MNGIDGDIFIETAARETEVPRHTEVPARALEKPVTAGATKANIFEVG